MIAVVEVIQIIVLKGVDIYAIGLGLSKILVAAFYGAGGGKYNLFNIMFPTIGAIWFLLANLWAIVMLSGIINITKRKSDWGRKIICSAFSLLLFFIAVFTSNYFWLPWSIQSSMCSLIFVYFGWEMRKANCSLVNNKYVIPGVAVWMLDIAFCLWNNKYFSLASCYAPDVLLCIIGAIAGSIIMIQISRIIEVRTKLISKLLAWFGENSIIILSFHLLENDYLPWHYLKLIPHLETNKIFYYILIVTLKVILYSIAIIVVHKSRNLSYIFLSNASAKSNAL